MNITQLRKCLSCQYARTALLNYDIVLNSSPIKDDVSQRPRDATAFFAKLVDSKATNPNDAVKEISSYFNKPVTPSDEFSTAFIHHVCLNYIHALIYNLKSFFSSDIEDITINYEEYTVMLLRDILKTPSQNEDSNDKILRETLYKNISHVEGLINKVDWEMEEINSENTDIKKIIESPAISGAQYAEVNKALAYFFENFIDAQNKNWEITGPSDCKYVKSIKTRDAMFSEFSQNYNSLNQMWKNIIILFMNRLPVGSSYVISKITEDKNISIELLRKLLGYSSSTQLVRWRDNPSLIEDSQTISALGLALLVDEDVIRYGNGKSYGTWEYLDNNNKEMLKALRYYDYDKENNLKDKEYTLELTELIAKRFKSDVKIISAKGVKGYLNYWVQCNCTVKDRNIVFPEKKHSIYQTMKEHYFQLHDPSPLNELVKIFREQQVKGALILPDKEASTEKNL